MPDECERSSLKSSTLKTRCTAPREGPVFARSISLNHLVRRVPAWAWGRIVLRSGAQFSEIWGHGRPGEPGDRDALPGSAAVFVGRHGERHSEVGRGSFRGRSRSECQGSARGNQPNQGGDSGTLRIPCAVAKSRSDADHSHASEPIGISFSNTQSSYHYADKVTLG
jgi:hypothetical protein